MNKSDSERIASLLESVGYKPASKKEADLILINMCSVRKPAVDRVYGQIAKLSVLKNKNKRLKTVLTGCVLKKDKKKFQESFDFILNVKDLPKWPGYLKPKIRNKKTNENYFKVEAKRQKTPFALIPISGGCNWSCSYCVVPFTRGRLFCRNHKEILKEAKSAVKKGFKEIWLLGQNVNDYNCPSDPLIDFTELLKMISNIPGNFKIKFISPNPKNFSDKLIKTIASSEKFSKYLNLPVQSGDDKILKKMRRPYTVKEYKNLVKKIRKEIPDINLSTDIIVGFPGETKKQFENTLKLCKEIKFDLAYISKYSPRPGTASAKTEDNVSFNEKKKREKALKKVIFQ